jgi:protein required for attachment to host cells
LRKICNSCRFVSLFFLFPRAPPAGTSVATSSDSPEEAGAFMKNDVWILSADTHRARLFCAHSPYAEETTEIKDFLQPDTMMHERDLVADSLGRYSQSGGHHDAQHARVPRTSPHEKSVIEFAKQIARYLDNEHRKGEFYKLGIVAEPEMLGALRNQMSDNLTRDLSFELHKNITRLNPTEFRQHLPERLAPTLQ